MAGKIKGLEDMARNFRKEYDNYQSSPEQIHKRSLRNQARRKLMKEGRVHKGDHKDVDHRKPLARGGSNSEKNLRVRSEHANRSFPRDREAHMANLRRAFHGG